MNLTDSGVRTTPIVSVIRVQRAVPAECRPWDKYHLKKKFIGFPLLESRLTTDQWQSNVVENTKEYNHARTPVYTRLSAGNAECYRGKYYVYSTYALEAEPQVRQKRSWNERGRRESKEKQIYNNNI